MQWHESHDAWIPVPSKMNCFHATESLYRNVRREEDEGWNGRDGDQNAAPEALYYRNFAEKEKLIKGVYAKSILLQTQLAVKPENNRGNKKIWVQCMGAVTSDTAPKAGKLLPGLPLICPLPLLVPVYETPGLHSGTGYKTIWWNCDQRRSRP